jgi:hypothetical protein
MGRRPLPKRINPLVIWLLIQMTTWGISSSFPELSPTSGQVTNALLTRSPLGNPFRPYEYKLQGSSFDLHVLGTPPTFILSQDQTLRKRHIFQCVTFLDLLRIVGVQFFTTIQLSMCCGKLLSFLTGGRSLCQLSGLNSTTRISPVKEIETKNRCLASRHRRCQTEQVHDPGLWRNPFLL